jgi:type II secretory pathway predicted ATPase ExeA
VLFGQPELDQHLALASMRQLRERITHSFTVPALPAD